MLLVNITALPWRQGRMKRNLAIFTNLIRSADFEAGLYVNPVRLERRGAADILRMPKVTTTTTYDIDSVPVTVLQPQGAFPLSWRSPRVALLSGQKHGRDLLTQHIRGRKFWLWMNSIGPVECGMMQYLAPRAEKVIFDNSDDMPTLEVIERQEEARRRLEFMLGFAQKTLCVNDHVAGTINHPDKTVFRNGTTFDSLQNSKPLEMPQWFPKPPGTVYVGFMGSFHETRVDVALVEHIFRSCPEYQFLIVGWVSPALEPVVARHPNVHHLGEVPNDQLGYVLRSFDAAMIPHIDNESTRGNDLLKMLDFHACEVPVVATAVSGITDSGYVAQIASADPDDFVARLRLCVTGQHGLDLARAREIARQRSWTVQVPQLARTLGLPPRPASRPA